MNENTSPESGRALPQDGTDDLQELEFSTLEPAEVAALEDRVYLLGCHSDTVRNG